MNHEQITCCALNPESHIFLICMDLMILFLPHQAFFIPCENEINSNIKKSTGVSAALWPERSNLWLVFFPKAITNVIYFQNTVISYPISHSGLTVYVLYMECVAVACSKVKRLIRLQKTQNACLSSLCMHVSLSVWVWKHVHLKFSSIGK